MYKLFLILLAVATLMACGEDKKETAAIDAVKEEAKTVAKELDDGISKEALEAMEKQRKEVEAKVEAQRQKAIESLQDSKNKLKELKEKSLGDQ
ncbi:hypothetical protein [Kangiella sp. HZ709]|uniref:hypothetical protein n=1 Tax=Kangiella sp. HZ709 TaxID=2666328 RepID=UPI0012AFA813|nr:hypothetical protein [Kangiella sp. HZ709]MRX26786.1 hypothetical protein [Kangiella sp. HZ709]